MPQIADAYDKNQPEMKKYMFHRIALLLALAFVCTPAVRAAEEGEEQAFDAKEIIFEHVLDNYGWEVPFSHSTRIPLPVIVCDKDGNWSMFSSHRVMHGETYGGYYIAPEGDFKGKVVTRDEAGNEYRPLDLSITKNVAALFITALLLCLCFIPMARWYRRHPNGAPRKWFGFMELVFDMLYNDLIKPVLGVDARRYSPYLLTVFFFIFFINILGLMVIFPAGANLSGNISITMVLALCTFLVVNLTGTKHYWKEIFWPEVPMWMKCPVPLMPVIEVFGALTKPVALMIRLFANMLGGHLIVLVLISLIFIFGSMGAAVLTGTTVISVFFSLFMMLLDVLISFIQAYVFTILSTIFISLARVRGESSHEESPIKE